MIAKHNGIDLQKLSHTNCDEIFGVVEVEMECKIGCEHLVLNGENSLCCGNKVPKLDSNGCLILKKI
jgi:hypothetical protein